MENKILIVEDESSIRSLLKISFQSEGYKVFEAESGELGLEKLRKEKPDIVILDVMLPGIDGFEVCKTIRDEFSEVGVIMLTARSQDMDKITGLENGADDYVIKPFNPVELVLRVKALLRRVNDKEESNRIIKSYPFKIDTYSQRIYKTDEELELTPKEYLLMKIFIENPGKAFSREELLNKVWGWDFIGEPKIVDVNIRRLRTKIEENSSKPLYIETVWGTGYRWRQSDGI